MVKYKTILKKEDLIKFRRLKENTDYTILTKHDKTYVTCFEVYKPLIEGALLEWGVKVDQWFFVP